MCFFFKNLYTKYRSKEVERFVIVGGSTVLIDCICYFVLVQFGFKSSFSKGLSFTLGAIYAYFANKNFTFRNQNYGLIQFLVFILLYITTLSINVITNETLLETFSQTKLSFIFAFISATFISATLNFMGMKYIVFIKKES